MFESIKALYTWLKVAVFGADGIPSPEDASEVKPETVPTQEAKQNVSSGEPTITEQTIAEHDGWTITPYNDPLFVKMGRVFMDVDDLVLRSDLDNRGFRIRGEDIDRVLDGETVSVYLLNGSGTAGTARRSTSGLAMNFSISPHFYTIPMRSLNPVLSGQNRKGPLFVPREEVEADIMLNHNEPANK